MDSCYEKENQWGTKFIEVIGRVEKDFSVMEFKSSNLGDSFGRFTFFFFFS